jgi:hypothetical protein
MIVTNANKSSLKAIRAKERAEREQKQRAECEAIAVERFGEQKIKEWSNSHKGLWYLPVYDEEGEIIEKLAIMKPIDRHILSYASTKISDEGLYIFLEACMNECFVEGDREVIDDDIYFLPASSAFNKIIDGRKAAMLKR